MSIEFIEKKLKESYDAHEVDEILGGLSCKRKTTFRVNHLKASVDDIKDTLFGLNIEYDTNQDYPDAFILRHYDSSRKRGFDTKTGLSIEDLTIYKEGKIYMQSLSSMKPVYVLEPKEGENILDMCAAPGSKTTMIQSITNNKVNLTACELHRDRFERLSYNIKLQGANVYALYQNACDLNDMLKFDKILIDAPCSGSGILDILCSGRSTVDRSPQGSQYNRSTGENFTQELIDRCVATQKKLIKKAYKLIKKGGIVVYSTCSLLKEENEDMVDYAKSIGFDVDMLDGRKRYIKIMPDEVFEGFFIARFRRL